MGDEPWEIDSDRGVPRYPLRGTHRYYLATGEVPESTDSEPSSVESYIKDNKIPRMPDRIQDLIDDLALMKYSDSLPADYETMETSDILNIETRSDEIAPIDHAHRVADLQMDAYDQDADSEVIQFGVEMGRLLRWLTDLTDEEDPTDLLWGLLIGITGTHDLDGIESEIERVSEILETLSDREEDRMDILTEINERYEDYLANMSDTHKIEQVLATDSDSLLPEILAKVKYRASVKNQKIHAPLIRSLLKSDKDPQTLNEHIKIMWNESQSDNIEWERNLFVLIEGLQDSIQIDIDRLREYSKKTITASKVARIIYEETDFSSKSESESGRRKKSTLCEVNDIDIQINKNRGTDRDYKSLIKHNCKMLTDTGNILTTRPVLEERRSEYRLTTYGELVLTVLEEYDENSDWFYVVHLQDMLDEELVPDMGFDISEAHEHRYWKMFEEIQQEPPQDVFHRANGRNPEDLSYGPS